MFVSTPATLDLRSPVEKYRTGPKWQRVEMPATRLSDTKISPLARQAYAMALVNESTGFYLGAFDGKHILATNHHVLPDATHCSPAQPIRFPLFNIETHCSELIGSWKEVDLALAEIVLGENTPLAQVAKNFAFNTPILHKTGLVTLGFGKAGNPDQKLTATKSWPCMVFSSNSIYRFLNDPHSTNRASYAAFSFAHGCDVSNGDSGAPLLHGKTGEILGLVWTGTFPKETGRQNAKYLRSLLKNPNNEEIWTVLNYGVPSEVIGKHLNKVIKDKGTPDGTKKVLTELIKGTTMAPSQDATPRPRNKPR